MKRFLLGTLIFASSEEIATQAAQNIETKTDTFSSAQELSAAINNQLVRGNTTLEQIKNTLAQWYKNNTSLFSASYCPFPAHPLDRNSKPNRDDELAQQILPRLSMTIRDDFLIGAHAYTYLCTHQGAEMATQQSDLRNRIAVIMLNLDKLDAKQNLSPEQIEIIGRIAAVAIWGVNLEANNMQERIRLLKKLAKISNIELPEKLKN